MVTICLFFYGRNDVTSIECEVDIGIGDGPFVSTH